MATTGVVISGAVSGDDYYLTYVLTGWPGGVTVIKAWWTAKVTVSDTGSDDTDAVVQKIVTTTPDPTQGHIVEDGSGGNPQIVIKLTQTDTRDIRRAGTAPLVYDFQTLDDAGDVATHESGTITILPEITLSAL